MKYFPDICIFAYNSTKSLNNYSLRVFRFAALIQLQIYA